jgi:hypothetical protein
LPLNNAPNPHPTTVPPLGTGTGYRHDPPNR